MKVKYILNSQFKFTGALCLSCECGQYVMCCVCVTYEFKAALLSNYVTLVETRNYYDRIVEYRQYFEKIVGNRQ